jgi:hypothetical protein
MGHFVEVMQLDGAGARNFAALEAASNAGRD